MRQAVAQPHTQQRHTDHHRGEGVGELDGEAADATCCGVDQHRLRPLEIAAHHQGAAEAAEHLIS